MVFQSYALFPHMSRARERPLRPRRVEHAEARGRRARARRARHRRPHRLRRAAAVGAFGRPAAARRRRARAGARARGAAVRRAAVEPRCAPAAADARGDPRPAAAAVADRRLRHARPGRSDGGIRPHHRDEQGGRSRRKARRANSTSSRAIRSSPASWATPIACAARSRGATTRWPTSTLGARDAVAAASRIAGRRASTSSIRPEAIDAAPPEATRRSAAPCAKPRTSAA